MDSLGEKIVVASASTLIAGIVGGICTTLLFGEPTSGFQLGASIASGSL